jgi:hypothetical protein
MLGSLLQHPEENVRTHVIQSAVVVTAELDRQYFAHCMRYGLGAQDFSDTLTAAVDSAMALVPELLPLPLYWILDGVDRLTGETTTMLLAIMRNRILLHQDLVSQIFEDRTVWVPHGAHLMSIFHGDADRSKEFELVMQIVVFLMVKILRLSKDAWKVLEDFAIALWSEPGRRSKGTPIMRDLMHRVLQALVCEPLQTSSAILKVLSSGVSDVCMGCFKHII